MDSKRDWITEYITEIQSIAQAGLFYSKDPYDLERFERLRSIAAEMMQMKTGLPLDTVKDLFCSDYGYQTPKVDTRAAVFKDDRILLVHEKSRNWALPGGWCEFNLSPADNALKEVKEESGKDAEIESVIAVQSRDKHNLPAYAYNVVKIFYLCRETGGEFIPNLETTDAEYFARDSIPPLALEKNTPEQIELCFEAHNAQRWITQFD